MRADADVKQFANKIKAVFIESGPGKGLVWERVNLEQLPVQKPKDQDLLTPSLAHISHEIEGQERDPQPFDILRSHSIATLAEAETYLKSIIQRGADYATDLKTVSSIQYDTHSGRYNIYVDLNALPPPRVLSSQEANQVAKYLNIFCDVKRADEQFMNWQARKIKENGADVNWVEIKGPGSAEVTCDIRSSVDFSQGKGLCRAASEIQAPSFFIDFLNTHSYKNIPYNHYSDKRGVLYYFTDLYVLQSLLVARKENFIALFLTLLAQTNVPPVLGKMVAEYLTLKDLVPVALTRKTIATAFGLFKEKPKSTDAVSNTFLPTMFLEK